MSAVTKHERPGVYSSYEASSLTAAAAGGGSVAVVAACGTGDGRTSYQWTSYSRAAADVGDCVLSRMAQLAIRNGAGVVYGIPAGEDYDAAFTAAAALEDVHAQGDAQGDPCRAGPGDLAQFGLGGFHITDEARDGIRRRIGPVVRGLRLFLCHSVHPGR